MGKLTADQHHAPLAGLTFQTNIRAQAGDFPLVTATRVWLTQPDDIAYLQIGQHEGIITRGGIIFVAGGSYAIFL